MIHIIDEVFILPKLNVFTGHKPIQSYELEASPFNISQRYKLKNFYSTDKSLPLSANDPINRLSYCVLFAINTCIMMDWLEN